VKDRATTFVVLKWACRPQAVPGGIEDHFCLVAAFRKVRDGQYCRLRPDPEARFDYRQDRAKIVDFAFENKGVKRAISAS
jgi:hypothetical protein